MQSQTLAIVSNTADGSGQVSHAGILLRQPSEQQIQMHPYLFHVSQRIPWNPDERSCLMSGVRVRQPVRLQQGHEYPWVSETGINLLSECILCDVVTHTFAECIEFTSLTFSQCGLVDGHRVSLIS